MVRGFLPISFGGLGVHRASLYAPSAFIGSLDHSKEVVSDILGHTSPTSVHLAYMLKDLASASGQNDKIIKLNPILATYHYQCGIQFLVNDNQLQPYNLRDSPTSINPIDVVITEIDG